MLCPAKSLTSACEYQPLAAMMAAIFTQNTEPIFDNESPAATTYVPAGRDPQPLELGPCGGSVVLAIA